MKYWAVLYLAAAAQGAVVNSAFAAQDSAPSAQGPNAAQSPSPAQSPDPAQSSTGVEEVVVTAQRREENLQKVPLAVTAFTAADIQREVAHNSTDLLKFVPNVIALNNGNQSTSANYFFRGVGASDGFQTTQTPVVTYVDEVPLGRIVGANLQFNDIASVEVLSGPQGTLFGRNVLGGAVLYTSRKPSDEYQVYAEGSYGSRNHVDGAVTIDVPITSTLFTSVSAYGMHEDPWETSVLTNEKYGQQSDFGGRLSARWDPSSDIEWNVSYDYAQHEGLKPNLPGKSNTGLAVGQSLPNANNKAGLGLDSWSLLYTLADSCQTGRANNGVSWAEHNCIDAVTTSQGITSNIKYTLLPNLALRLITGVRLTDQDSDIEFSGNTPGAAFQEFLIADDSHYKQFSQEIKFDGSLFQNRITYTAGAFYFYEGIGTRVDYFFQFPAIGYNTLSREQDEHLDNNTTSVAGYLQGDVHVTDKLTVTAGGRYTADRETVGVDYLGYSPTGRDPALDFNTSQISGQPKITSGRFTPKVDVQYQFTPQIMGYASYTKGYQAGGWSGRSSTALGFNSFGPEYVTSYEVGERSELFDRRLRLNVTLFRAEYKDLQINTAFTPPGESVTVFVTGNSGDAYDQGVEVASQFVVTPEITGHVAMGFQHSEYTRLAAAAIASSGFSVGGPLSYAPSQTYSGGAVWSRDVAALRGRVSLSADLQYVPSFNPNLFAASVPTVDIFTLNSELTYVPSRSKLEFSLECRNCTQHYYIINTSSQGGGALAEIPFAGLRVRYKM